MYVYIYMYMYIYIYMISRQNALHVSSCYTCLLWVGPYRFPGFCEKSACSRSNMKPKSIPRQAQKWIEELFCWFKVLGQHFMFLSFPVIFLSFSFQVPFICTHFLFSFYVPLIFNPMCIPVLSSSFQFAFMFLSFCIHIPSFPF